MAEAQISLDCNINSKAFSCSFVWLLLRGIHLKWRRIRLRSDRAKMWVERASVFPVWVKVGLIQPWWMLTWVTKLKQISARTLNVFKAYIGTNFYSCLQINVSLNPRQRWDVLWCSLHLFVYELSLVLPITSDLLKIKLTKLHKHIYHC